MTANPWPDDLLSSVDFIQTTQISQRDVPASFPNAVHGDALTCLLKDGTAKLIYKT